ncbi:unnamed protein product [Caenorhabditis sp. 36 PRJEB53466]|nr:unnamed protein product [Caenorhabditis sp. 36 PRJEB53466]
MPVAKCPNLRKPSPLASSRTVTPGFTQCPSGSWLKVRGANTVCVTIRLFASPYCKNRAAAVALCETDSGLGLTGPYDTAENSAIQGYTNTTYTANKVAIWSAYTSVLVWIDGYYISTSGTFNMTDKTLTNGGVNGYDWEAFSRSYIGVALGNCVYLVPNVASGVVRARDCSQTSSGTSFCFRGAVCLKGRPGIAPCFFVAAFEPPATCLLVNPIGVATVQKVAGSSGMIVGFKRTLTLTTCPSTPADPPMFGETSVTETISSNTTIYSYTISSSTSTDNTTTWTVTFSGFMQCSSGSWIKVRGANTVCVTMLLFDAPFCKNQTSAESVCRTGNAIGMTGPYDGSENSAFQGYVVQVLSEASDDTKSVYGNYSQVVVWLDGVYVATSTVNITDDTLNGVNGYNWEAGSYWGYGPTVGQCIYLVTNTNEGRVRAYACNATTVTSGVFCLGGAACLTQPVYQF